MRYTEIYEDIAGICVACHQCLEGVVYMLSHRRTSLPPASSYARVESAVGHDLVWIYFPIGLGESISGVWVYERAGSSYDRCPGVIVSLIYSSIKILTKSKISYKHRMRDT